MICIFCREERPPSEEHVFPKAIGGCLSFHRVCAQCNSTLGNRVDAALSDNFLIRTRRAELALAGNSGAVPQIHDILIGTHELADFPGRSVQVSFNNETGKLALRAIHHAIDIELPDGSKARRITVDASDITNIGKIITRERKRHGVHPLTPEQLVEEVRQFSAAGIEIVTNPKVNIRLTVNFAFVRHALIKIAYELAFLWLGEDYLSDPIAEELRRGIITDAPGATDNIRGYTGEPIENSPLELWRGLRNHHLAMLVISPEGVATIFVRVFNIFTAIIPVTVSGRNYFTKWPSLVTMPFLALDPKTREKQSLTLLEAVKWATDTAARQYFIDTPST